MKCTNCGKNNASYHIRSIVNGQVTEAHLCPECAGKLQPEREFAARSRELLGDFWEDGFFDGSSLLGDFFGQDPFQGLFRRPLLGMSPFASFGAPRIEISFPAVSGQEPEGPETAGSSQADPELSRRREINALREQMRAAIEAEDYEKAARLRDKLRAMEEKGN